jgi:hypothetical protein
MILDELASIVRVVTGIVHSFCSRKRRLRRRDKAFAETKTGYDSPCFGIPSVMSTEFLRQATQRFAPFGSIGVPQSAQRTRCMAGEGTNSIVRCWLVSKA